MARAIAISMGDPAGIGAEVIVKALAAGREGLGAGVRIWGSGRALAEAAVRAGITPFWSEGERAAGPGEVLLSDDTGGRSFAAGDTVEGGEASYRWVEAAIAACRAGECRALVTGPISKHAWSLAGHGEFAGHTELLAERFGAPRHAMMFVTPRMRVVLATAHIPLARVAQVLSTERILDVMELGAAACRGLGIASPRIGVCGLNPHAGERGLLGEEDARIIAPAIARAREAGIDAAGPFPGDTIFRDAIERPGAPRRFDLVVAMYHDQGLIPVKLLDFERAVNCTIGLPVPRTSPDHGTAFDIAGTNRADAGSMRAAIELAAAMAGRGFLRAG